MNSWRIRISVRQLMKGMHNSAEPRRNGIYGGCTLYISSAPRNERQAGCVIEVRSPPTWSPKCEMIGLLSKAVSLWLDSPNGGHRFVSGWACGSRNPATAQIHNRGYPHRRPGLIPAKLIVCTLHTTGVITYG